MTIKAYYDRQPRTIDGFFSLKDGSDFLVEKIWARSGQQACSNTSWDRGQSPIPYSKEVVEPLKIWLTPYTNGKDFDPDGIGLFWPISTSQIDRGLIKGWYPGQERRVVGLHPENRFDGSAGCIVLRWDNAANRGKVEKLFKIMQDLRKTMDYIDLQVL